MPAVMLYIQRTHQITQPPMAPKPHHRETRKWWWRPQAGQQPNAKTRSKLTSSNVARLVRSPLFFP